MYVFVHLGILIHTCVIVCLNVIVCMWSPDGNPEYDYSETRGVLFWHILSLSTLGWLGSQQVQGSICLHPFSTVIRSLNHCNCLFFKNMDSEDFTPFLPIAEHRRQKGLSSQISFSYLSMKRTLLFNDWR